MTIKRIWHLMLQGALIIILYYIGSLISHLIEPFFFIPGSLVGMIMLFGLLYFNVIQLSFIEELGGFLLKHMGFFFIPLGASVMKSRDLLNNQWLSLLGLLIVSCILVMWISAKVVDLMILHAERRKS